MLTHETRAKLIRDTITSRARPTSAAWLLNSARAELRRVRRLRADYPAQRQARAIYLDVVARFRTLYQVRRAQELGRIPFADRAVGALDDSSVAWLVATPAATR